jgi:hypothetical protein
MSFEAPAMQTSAAPALAAQSLSNQFPHAGDHLRKVCSAGVHHAHILHAKQLKESSKIVERIQNKAAKAAVM